MFYPGDLMAKMTGYTLSFLVDDRPVFFRQAWMLVQSLAGLGVLGAPGVGVAMHHTPAVPEGIRARFRDAGVETREVPPFGDGAAVYCNKLRQLESDLATARDYLIMVDTDTVFRRDPARLATGAAVRAKPVDQANPSLPVLLRLAARRGGAGLALEALRDLHRPVFGGRLPTPRANCNGGLYVIPRATVAPLRESWIAHARFCLGQETLLQGKLHHADQLGFCLSVLDGTVAFDPLAPGENFPSQFRRDLYEACAPCEIGMLHYHKKTRADGRPAATGIGWIDSQLAEIDTILDRGAARIGAGRTHEAGRRHDTDPRQGVLHRPGQDRDLDLRAMRARFGLSPPDRPDPARARAASTGRHGGAPALLRAP